VVRRPYLIHPVIIQLVQHYLAEIYGVDLAVDALAGKDDAVLPLFGLDVVHDQCIRDGHAAFILSDWRDYDRVVA